MKYVDLDDEEVFYNKKEKTSKAYIDEDLGIKTLKAEKTRTQDILDSLYTEPVKKESKVLNKINEIDVPQIEYKSKSDSILEEEHLDSVCNIIKTYGNESVEGFFLKENLFSELISDYQRAVARFNLGIGEEYSLVWGNITGDIKKQEDLYEFLTNSLDSYVDDYTGDVNDLLVRFTAEVNRMLSQKVNRHSPHLEGIPTTSLPGIDDDSARIASTEWVNQKLSMDESNILKFIKLSSDHMFYGEPPKTIVLSWEFYQPVEEVKVNGEIINITNKSMTIPNLDGDYLIHFYYKVGGIEYNKFLTFNKVHAYYYNFTGKGIPTTGTKDFPFLVDSGQDKFVYLYIPNDNKARLSVDNIYGGFVLIDSMIINGILYYLYRTVNYGLGEIHLKYDKK